MISADLLLVALAVLAEAAGRVEVEALDQRRLVGAVDAAAQVGEVLERLAARSAGRTGRTRRGGSRCAGGSRPGRPWRLDAEDAGAARGRPDQVEQQPDRRRLAGAVRTEEAEDLALLDREVDVDDPAVRAVGLGELLGSMTAVMRMLLSGDGESNQSAAVGSSTSGHEQGGMPRIRSNASA